MAVRLFCLTLSEIIDPRRLYTSKATVQLVLRIGFKIVRLLSESGEVAELSSGIANGGVSKSSTVSVSSILSASGMTSLISVVWWSSDLSARLPLWQSRPLTISFLSLMRSVDSDDRISSDDVYASISFFVAAVRALVAVKGHLKPWVLLSAVTEALRQLGLDFKEVFLGAGLPGCEVEGLLGSRLMNRASAIAKRSMRASGYCCKIKVIWLIVHSLIKDQFI